MFESYLSRMSEKGPTISDRHKANSDEVMDATWWNDPQTQTVYLYDWKHDGEPDKFKDIHPKSYPKPEPFDAKFIVTQYEAISKDQVEYHLEFRPGELERRRKEFDYYDDELSKFGAEFPVGLYVGLKDPSGNYNRWLIVSKNGGNQFIKYSILPCNFYFHWIFNAKKHDLCGVARLRNSYNSGEWTNDLITIRF